MKEDLKNKLEEAITSNKTSKETKELLVQIKEELLKAKNEKDYFALVLKLIDLLGALAKVYIGSG